jgi:membrane protein YqaA with SNARE-associated domain
VLHEGLTLVEVADAADLTAMQADARLKDFILARLSPTEAVVLPQHSQAFLKALLKAGHTPKVG